MAYKDSFVSDPSRTPPNSPVGNGAPLVLVLPHQQVEAWPKTLIHSGHYPLEVALQQEWDGDAHISQYSCPHIPGRITRGNLPLVQGGLLMVNVVVDLDDADSKLNGQRLARPFWVDDQLSRISRLSADLGAFPFTWQSRGGLKFLIQLQQSIALDASEAHWRWWSRQYVYFLLLLWERYGLIADPSCKPPTNLFRLPQVTRDGKFVRHPTWGSPHQGPMLELRDVPAPSSAGVQAAQRLAAVYRGTWPKALAELRIAKAKPLSRSKRLQVQRPASLDLNSRFVSELAAEVQKYEDGRHNLYLQLAGALCQLRIPNVEGTIGAVATATADSKLARRVSDARTTLKRFARGEPIVGFDQLLRDYASIADVLLKHVPVPTGAEQRARQELEARQLPAPVDVGTARTSFITAALAGVDSNQVVVLAAPTGVGKTRAASNIAQAVSPERKVAILCPSNIVAEELFAHLGTGQAKRRLGVLATRTTEGAPECIHAPSAASLQHGGYSVRQELCPKCKRSATCTARVDHLGARIARIEVSNHALVHKSLTGLGFDGLLILDEMPAVTESMILQPSMAHTIAELLRENVLERQYVEAVYPAALGFSELLRNMMEAGDPLDHFRGTVVAQPDLETRTATALATAGLQSSGQVFDDVTAALHWALEQNPTPPITPVARQRLSNSGASFARRLSLFSRSVSFLADALCDRASLRWADVWTKTKIDNESGGAVALVATRLNPRLRAALSHKGPVLIFDATPDIQAVGALASQRLTTQAVDVHDGAPIRRIILATSIANRAKMLASDTGVGRALIDKGLAVVAEAQTVLLVTYKPLLDSIEVQNTLWSQHFRESGRRLVTAHYGHVRGQNKFQGVTWEEIDAIVTVGDPWPNRTQMKEQIVLLGIQGDIEDRGKRLAEAELAQAHGRIRACRRSRKATLVHVGSLVPLGWNKSNTEIRSLPPGPPPRPTAMPLHELQVIVESVGIRELARRVVCDESTIRGYVRGRPMTIEMANRIRQHVESQVAAIHETAPVTT